MYCKCQNPNVSYPNKVDFDYNVMSYLGMGVVLTLSLRLEMDNKRRAKRAGDFLGNQKIR